MYLVDRKALDAALAIYGKMPHCEVVTLSELGLEVRRLPWCATDGCPPITLTAVEPGRWNLAQCINAVRQLAGDTVVPCQLPNGLEPWPGLREDHIAEAFAAFGNIPYRSGKRTKLFIRILTETPYYFGWGKCFGAFGLVSEGKPGWTDRARMKLAPADDAALEALGA